MKYDDDPKDWEVQKYGEIIDDYEVKRNGKYIRQKIHLYEGKLYVATWYDGIRLLFHELYD